VDATGVRTAHEVALLPVVVALVVHVVARVLVALALVAQVVALVVPTVVVPLDLPNATVCKADVFEVPHVQVPEYVEDPSADSTNAMQELAVVVVNEPLVYAGVVGGVAVPVETSIIDSTRSPATGAVASAGVMAVVPATPEVRVTAREIAPDVPRKMSTSNEDSVFSA
jgi:hypothetical protein